MPEPQIRQIFKARDSHTKPRPILIGMVHTLPLPGSDGFLETPSGSARAAIKDLIEHTVTEAKIYQKHGFDAILIENMHDLPYLNGRVEPETTAAMTAVATRIRSELALPIGLQLLAAANIEALGVALAADLDFIRAESFVFSHVGDEGMHDAQAPQLIRRRAQLGARHIQIFADIKKKHSAHAITQDVPIDEIAHAAAFFKADGVIVTGRSTGQAIDLPDLQVTKKALESHMPRTRVLVGSGVDADNLATIAPHADGMIVGSYVKKGGHWANEIDQARVANLVDKVNSI